MKNWKAYGQFGAWSVLILLLIPPLWYSLRTSFGLIDDYDGWYNLQSSFSHMAGIISWFQPQARFRITFDLYQLVTWWLLGDNSALHHGMRWVLKAIVVWSTFKIIRLLASEGRSATGLSFWVFCAIYLFFPNNPEARLAPQELLTVTFLAVLLYELCRLCVRMQGNLTMLSLKRYLWLLFVFTAMLWSKEPNILIGMVILPMLICLNLKRWLHLLPFVVILLITGLRVWAESHSGGYGTAPITWSLILRNFGFYRRCLFLEKSSVVCTAMLIIPLVSGFVWLMIQTWKTRLVENRGVRGMVLWLQTHPALTCYWLICFNFVAYYAGVLTSWETVLRYFYPLVYLLALWIGLSLLAIESLLSRGHWAVIKFIVIAYIYFIGVNYYNFVYQFASQYYTRAAEEDLLQTTDGLLRDGKTVTMSPGDEYDYSVRDYFNDYLPYYKHTDYRITVGPPITLHCGDGCYYVTQQMQPFPAGLNWYRQINHCHVSRILWWCDRISSWFKFGHPNLIWVDAGAPSIGLYGEETRIWYIYNCPDIWGCPK